MTRKIIYAVLSLICLLFITFCVKECSFSPLGKQDFQLLFSNYNGKVKKMGHTDYIRLSFKGEYLDIYLYKMLDSAYINSDYPIINKTWENRNLPHRTILSKWKKCPPDSMTIGINDWISILVDSDKKKYSNMFARELQNGNNYYSYVYSDDLENYFFLYCPADNSFFYIRRNGF